MLGGDDTVRKTKEELLKDIRNIGNSVSPHSALEAVLEDIVEAVFDMEERVADRRRLV